MKLVFNIIFRKLVLTAFQTKFNRPMSQQEKLMSVPLRQLAKEETASISAVTAEGEIGRRLRDMGLSPGTEITIIGRAPLKDPIAVRLRNFTLTLRNNEADYILVEKRENISR
jgi:ferrous iron transport protein A